jgi:DNA-binding HxlR family transcriptional regulator
MVTKKSNRNEPNECLPITATMDIMAGKWKPVILYKLTFGTRRFGEILARIPNISRKVLTQQLKELEKDGLVIRKEFSEIQPRVEYSLTEKSRSLEAIYKEISDWGTKNLLADVVYVKIELEE